MQYTKKINGDSIKVWKLSLLHSCGWKMDLVKLPAAKIWHIFEGSLMEKHFWNTKVLILCLEGRRGGVEITSKIVTSDVTYIR